jgi:hypothetical protein
VDISEISGQTELVSASIDISRISGSTGPLLGGAAVDIGEISGFTGPTASVQSQVAICDGDSWNNVPVQSLITGEWG